jgi:hypothetical protein
MFLAPKGGTGLTGVFTVAIAWNSGAPAPAISVGESVSGGHVSRAMVAERK